MRLKFLFSAILLAIVLFEAGCSGPPATTPSGTPVPAGGGEPTISAVSGKGLSAKEAVALAYAALPAEWKPTARLAFVGRYSKFCNVGCSPLVVEEDPGIGSDGRQAHWVVVFTKDETGSPANAFYVENGEVRLVASDLATVRPDEVFPLDGWVDSTEIQFRTSQPVGLELRTSDLFEDVDAELGRYSLLWLAETSFGRFDVYDATTGQYIKSR